MKKSGCPSEDDVAGAMGSQRVQWRHGRCGGNVDDAPAMWTEVVATTTTTMSAEMVVVGGRGQKAVPCSRRHGFGRTNQTHPHWVHSARLLLTFRARLDALSATSGLLASTKSLNSVRYMFTIQPVRTDRGSAERRQAPNRTREIRK